MGNGAGRRRLGRKRKAPRWRLLVVGLASVAALSASVLVTVPASAGANAPSAGRSGRTPTGHTVQLRKKLHVIVRDLPLPRRGGPRQAKPFLPAPKVAPAGQPARPARPVTTAGLALRPARAARSRSAPGPETVSPSASVQRLNTFPTLGNVNSKVPSDTVLAVGPTDIVQMVNVSGQVYDKLGNPVGSAFDLGTFFGVTKGQGTDPRVVYDASTGRFYAAYEGLTAGGDTTKVAVSDSSDPTGGWTTYTVAQNNSNVLQDQEKLGFSNDKVTLSWNDYDNTKNPPAFQGVVTAVLNKADLVAEGSVHAFTFSLDSGKFQVVPAVSLGSINDQLALWRNTGSTDVHVLTITGVPGVSTVSESDNTIGIGTADSPPAAAQPSGGDPTITTNDDRMLSVVWQDNHLWGAFNVKCTPPGDSTTRACIRYVQISTSGGQSLATNENLGMDGGDIYFGSVTLDGQNDLFSGLTASSSSIFATAVAFGLPGGNFPATTLGDFYYAGTQAYVCGCGTLPSPPNPPGTLAERWGDYFGIAPDPGNTNDVWTVVQAGGFAGGDWGTAMDRVTLSAPAITSISPAQGPPGGGTTVDIFGSEFANGATTVNFGASTASSVTWIDPGHIQAVSPPGSVGTVDVTATTGDGTSATSPSDQFTYRKFPTSTTYTGATSGDFNDQVTLSARLTNTDNSQGVAGKTISFSVGAESCAGTTGSTGVASCQVTLADAPGSYIVQATFTGDVNYEASGAGTPFTVNREQSQVTYTGATTSHYHDPAAVSATLTDPDGGAAIAGKTITFSLGNGSDSCTGTTDGMGKASCTLTPSQTGNQNIVVSFAGDTDYVSSSDTKTFSITQEETTMAYTGPTLVLAGASGATLTAKLVEDGNADNDGDAGSKAPVPAQSVTLAIGAQTCTATTDTSGNVSCTIPSVSVPLGPEVVGATFAGDAHYAASSDSKTAIVFAFPSSGAFALGDKTVATATPSTTVTWWADTWSSLNKLSGGAAPPNFKGFAGAVTLPTTTPPTNCGSNWTTSTGNSPPPPATVPSYMGTLVTSKVTKSGNTISGNTVSIVVVKTNPGYSPSPLNHGTGQIVAKFC
jgi:IPT/TIG domain-containing protein